MGDGECDDEVAKVPVGGGVKAGFEGVEKRVEYFGYSADSKHAVIPSISVCNHNSYRQNRPHFFHPNYNHKSESGQFELILKNPAA